MKSSSSLVSGTVAGQQHSSGWRMNVGKRSKHVDLQTLIHALFFATVTSALIRFNGNACAAKAIPNCLQHRGD